jgi:hypothetical protein
MKVKLNASKIFLKQPFTKKLRRVVLIGAKKALPRGIMVTKSNSVVILTIATVQTPSPRTTFWSLPSRPFLESLPVLDFKRISTISEKNNFFLME